MKDESDLKRTITGWEGEGGRSQEVLRMLSSAYCMLLLLSLLLLVSLVAHCYYPYPYISTLSRVFFLKFPFDFIYMVNEEGERSRRRERKATIRFVLFTYVYFPCMSSECCTTNDDGGPDE